MKSMTGFGTVQFQVKGIPAQATVRTVNGRYLEIRTHLPRELQNLEFELKSLAKKTFERGTVDISISFSNLESLIQYKVDFDKSVAKEWSKKANLLKKELKMSGELDLKTLLSLPGVVRTHKESKIEGADKQFLKGAAQAFKKCLDFRKKEGSSLKKVISNLLSELESCCLKIAGQQSKIEKNISQSLKRDIENEATLEGRSILESRASESLERMNIEEELSRLREHIKAVKKLTLGSGPTGKKMDFYAQEFLREMNTIGSKSASPEITAMVVQGKSFIESFREQVQNIE